MTSPFWVCWVPRGRRRTTGRGKSGDRSRGWVRGESGVEGRKRVEEVKRRRPRGDRGLGSETLRGETIKDGSGTE